MKQPTRHTIDDREYEFFPLAPKPALKVLTRLSKLVFEPLGLFGDALAGGGGAKAGIKALLETDASKFPPDLFARVARAIVERLNEDEVLDTVLAMLSNVHVQDAGAGDKGTRPLKFDVDFAGRIGHLIKVFGKSLEVNYSDFFDGLGVDLSTLVERGMKAMR